MRRYIPAGPIISFLISFFLVAFVQPPSVAQNGDSDRLTGREIMEEQEERHSADSEIELQQMLLVDSDGNKKKRRLKRYSLDQDEKNVFRYLLVFEKPNDIRGTSLLTWQHDNKTDDQWLYLPAMGRLKRIASGSKSSYFMGTDYTYEDLSPEKLDNFNYKRVEDGTFRGKETFQVIATPVDEYDETGYSKRRMWLRKDIFFTVKVKYFNLDGTHIKTQSTLEVENVQGKMYRGTKSVMENHDRDHKTLILLEDQKINVPLDESLFTERTVLNENALSRDDF